MKGINRDKKQFFKLFLMLLIPVIPINLGLNYVRFRKPDSGKY